LIDNFLFSLFFVLVGGVVKQRTTQDLQFALGRGALKRVNYRFNKMGSIFLILAYVVWIS